MLFDYEIYADIDRDGLFANGLGDITDYVISCNWSHGMNAPWQAVAASAYLNLTLNNDSGAFNLSDTGAAYYGKLTPGILIRVRIANNGTTTKMAVLKIKQIIPLPDPTDQNNPAETRLNIICEDVVAKFLDQEFAPSLREDVSIDEALTEIFERAEFIYPYDGAWFYIDTSEIDGDDIIYDYTQENLLVFEEAYTILPYAGDNLDRGKGSKIQAYIRDLMKAEFSGMFFWDVRNEQFKFFHRYHNLIVQKDPYVARTSSYIFEMDDIARFKSSYAEGFANEVTVNYYPRAVGAPKTVVASSSAVPFAIAAGDTRKIKMRYRDITNPDASVGAKDVLPPLSGLDFTGNSEADGSGDDWTRFMIVKSVRSSAEETEIEIYIRKVGDPVFVTLLQQRGTPIISYARESVTVSDGESRRLYDKSVMPTETCRAIASADMAKQYANLLLGTFKTPDTFFKTITLIPKDNDIAEQIQTRVIGDVITIKDSQNVSTNYMIVGEAHEIDLDNGLHMATWTLRPLKYGTPFIIDTSEIDGTDLILV